MFSTRPDPHESKPFRQPHYRVSWCQEVVLTRGEANRLMEAVSAAMALAGYAAPDTVKMRLALEEAICNLLHHGQPPARAMPVRVSYRVNELFVVAEIQAMGLEGSTPSGHTPAGGRSFLTWIRYSKQGHCATWCDCRLIR
jgi:hypothetical protein